MAVSRCAGSRLLAHMRPMHAVQPPNPEPPTLESRTSAAAVVEGHVRGRTLLPDWDTLGGTSWRVLYFHGLQAHHCRSVWRSQGHALSPHARHAQTGLTPKP